MDIITHSTSSRATTFSSASTRLVDGRALRKEAKPMKTMTCKQLGGPCDLPLHGNTANEVIKAQDSHLKEMVATGDETHSSALKEMQGRWKHPVSGMTWYRKAKRDFAALPPD